MRNLDSRRRLGSSLGIWTVPNSAGKGTTILITKTVQSRFVWVFVLVTTLGSFAYFCRTRIGGPWIGRNVQMRVARRASPEIGGGPRWTRIQCLSSLMMIGFFRPAVHQEDQQGGSSGPFRLGEGDNHTHCQNCRIKACLGACFHDNTCEFCISLQGEDLRAMDWARCANERRKESKSRSRERAQMDEDAVSRAWWWWFFRPAVHQEDQQEGSSGPFRLGEGDNHTHRQNCTIKACLGVWSRDNTCVFCIYL